MIKNPNNWSCLLAAAAMALHCEMDSIINFLGHDGSEQAPNGDRRGFHLQEIARFAWERLSLCLCPIERDYGIQTPGGHIFAIHEAAYFDSRIMDEEAILEGRTFRCGHACYWDGHQVVDPRGVYNPDDFTIIRAWLII